MIISFKKKYRYYYYNHYKDIGERFQTVDIIYY